jgi:heme-degrading monooxygenase HmoA
MYARVTTLTIQTGRGTEAVKIYKTSVLPAAQAQKGYRGSYVLADWKTDKGITVTLWRSEKDALANEENLYYQEQLVKVMNLFAAPPIREGYDVAIAAPKRPAKKKK